MNQPALNFAARSVSLTDRLAAYFTARPNQWIDARELLTVAGFGGWRTRISNLRYPPYAMVIENRQFRRPGMAVSEYRYKAKDSGKGL